MSLNHFSIILEKKKELLLAKNFPNICTLLKKSTRLRDYNIQSVINST